MVETPPNSSLSFLKNLSNKVIKLLSLPLLYSLFFFKLPIRLLVKLVKSLMVEKEIWSSIPAYTKNRLVFWSDDEKLSSKANL